MSDYEIIRCDRVAKTGGGVAFVCNRCLRTSVVLSNSVNNGFELLCLDVLSVNWAVRLVLVYRAPSCDRNLTDRLFNIISDLISNDLESVVLGDFNMPDFYYPADRAVGTGVASSSLGLQNLVSSHGLLPLVRESTRGDNILDLVLASMDGLVNHLRVGPPIGSSDHNSISFVIAGFKGATKHSALVSRRLYSHADYDAIRIFLSQVRWIDLFESQPDVNSKYELFLMVLQKAIDIFIPIKRVSSDSVAHLPAYLSSMVNHRECLFHEAKRTDNWETFDKYNAEFDNKLRKFNNYLEAKAVESVNPRKFYKFLNSRLQDRKGIGCLRGENMDANTDHTKAELLAKEFAKVFLKDDGILPAESRCEHTVMESFPWFDGLTLLRLLKGWPPSSSVTPDEVPFNFIQKIADVICAPLAYIFNQSLMYSQVPARWKHSYVTPVFKKGDPSKPENYRPISITSNLCRLFEKVLKEHILEFASKHGILPAAQHGFMQGRSVETNLLECINDWGEALDKNLSCDVIYFDFSKAFDRVSHRKLVSKLSMLNFHPVIVKWIGEFLSNRTFQVRLGQSLSGVKAISSGVPQGGVLSPILFNLYTADLPTIIEPTGVKVKMYADDIKLYKVIVDSEDVGRLQEAVDLLVQWSKRWQLPLSPSKTVYMSLYQGRPPDSREYHIDNSPIEAVSSVKDLGFHYDAKLDFSEHVSNCCRRAQHRTYQIFKGLTTRNKAVLIRAYKSYVRPLVESSTTVFSPSRKNLINALEKVQNNFTRKVLIRTGGFLYSRVPKATIRNKYLGLHSLTSRRKIFDICMVYKLLHQPRYRESRFFTMRVSHTKGEHEKIFLPCPRSRFKVGLFPHRAASAYLRAAKCMRSSFSLEQLKRSAQKSLLSYEA